MPIKLPEECVYTPGWTLGKMELIPPVQSMNLLTKDRYNDDDDDGGALWVLVVLEVPSCSLGCGGHNPYMLLKGARLYRQVLVLISPLHSQFQNCHCDIKYADRWIDVC